MSGEIRLDKRMFEVLSSDTRRKILVNLYSHPLTVSDLSRLLGIQKSAVHEHLQILIDVELVFKKESDNEFVYYDLTEKGRALIDQESNPGYKIFIAFSASIISLIGGLIGIGLYAVNVLNISLPAFNVAPGTPAITPIPTSYPTTSLPTPQPVISPIATAPPTPVISPIATLPVVPSSYFNVSIADIEFIIGVCLILFGLVLLYYSLSLLRSNKFYGISIPFIRR
jgi:DNA-binding transcriptional ArsR family regulator